MNLSVIWNFSFKVIWRQFQNKTKSSRHVGSFSHLLFNSSPFTVVLTLQHLHITSWHGMACRKMYIYLKSIGHQNTESVANKCGDGDREERRGVMCLCERFACILLFFWNRRKLCNKISPSQGHQFNVSNTWINQNVECLFVCVWLLLVVRCDFHEFSFCVLYVCIFAMSKSEEKTGEILSCYVSCMYISITLRGREDEVLN